MIYLAQLWNSLDGPTVIVKEKVVTQAGPVVGVHIPEEGGVHRGYAFCQFTSVVRTLFKSSSSNCTQPFFPLIAHGTCICCWLSLHFRSSEGLVSTTPASVNACRRVQYTHTTCSRNWCSSLAGPCASDTHTVAAQHDSPQKRQIIAAIATVTSAAAGECS